MSQQRIMIVEDEHIVALDISKQLGSFGYATSGIHATGEEALLRVEAEKPDLVLMDIRLAGDMDGLEAARLLRNQNDVPVVMLSAFADDETLERAKDSGPIAYLVKPFDKRELRSAIVTALNRHRLEQMLAQRERLFSTTLESIVDAVIVTDVEGRIEFVNPVACTMLGLDPLESLGKPFDGMVEFVEHEETGKGRAGENKVVFTALTADGRSVQVERTATPVYSSPGNQRGWVWVLHDVTARLENEEMLHQQRERLRQSQKMEAIGRLTGGIAHDFNNLLTVIMGYSRLIMDELEEPDELARERITEDVEGIQKAAGKSAALTRQLLSFSRNQDADRRPTDVGETLSRMENILRQLLKEDVSLTLDLTGGMTVVYADPSQLEQVIMNLVVNARDAMPEGGRLLIRTEGRSVSERDVIGRGDVSPGEFVVLSISDTGTGMDRQTVDRIFDPFFTTKEEGSGTGLGLSTVYGIVHRSGGFVDVESAPGKGTTFSVFLPAYLEQVEEAGTADSTESADTGGETILLVEDDESIRQLAGRLLRQKGYQVLDAANAGEALLEAENHGGPIHLLLSDVVMPLMSGVRLAERLRASRPETKVLLMSGYPDSNLTDEECTRLGITFLQKPVAPDTLTRTVRVILDG